MIENRLLDSNILVYAFDRSEKEPHGISKSLLNTCLDGREQFFVSLQNISEFYRVVTCKIENPLPKAEARKICQKILTFSGFRKIAPTADTLPNAMYLNDRYGVPYWDALLAASLLENRVFVIYTQNVRDFEGIPGIRAVNPFPGRP